MPSPFPGMDPFLEDPAVFPDLHDSLITYSRESLQSRLPEPYYCVIGSRIWMAVRLPRVSARFRAAHNYSVYPVRLQDKLPEIIVPLLPGDAPMTLDVQQLFDRCYDTGPYDRWVQYDGEMPAPPLSAEQIKWVKQILAGKHARR